MTAAAQYILFDTAIGPMGLAWSARGISRVVYPRINKRATEKELRAHAVPAGKTPPHIKQAVTKLQRHLKGRKVDHSDVALHIEGTELQRRIYTATRKIPWGQTASYGDIARMIGSPGAARVVGRAMSECNLSLFIPCHRITAAGQKVSGSDTGVASREKLLRLEGVYIKKPARPDPHMGELDMKKALQTLSTADPELGKLIRAIGDFGITQKRPGTPFQRLAEAVIYQQLATKAAAAISKRVKTALEGEWHPEGVLRADMDLLRMAGLSRSKAATIKALAENALNGTIPHVRSLQGMSDEEIIARLTTTKGIGEWTAQMYLMFSLLRPDVMPATDYGVRKGFQIAFKMREMPSVRAVQKRGERWRPYRSIASWYLWRATDSL